MMGTSDGFIQLHRRLFSWEWYTTGPTKDLFIHLLLLANFADTRYKGILVKRGQVYTSLPLLAQQTGLSVKQVRTALNHLISTGEVADESTTQYRIITVIKYDVYQKGADETADEGQTKGRRGADEGQHNNKDNKDNNGKKNKSLTRFIPPTLDEVKKYIQEINSPIDPERFFYHYETRGWELRPGQMMKNWKACVRTWERNGRDGHGEAAGDAGKTKKHSELYDTVIRL